QPDLSFSILKGCKDNGIHTAIETSGHCQWAEMERLLPVTDLILYDLKAMDPQLHKELTGQENGRILENARKIVRHRVEVQFRMPVVPGMNMEKENISQTAKFLRSLGKKSIILLPYHRLGEEKYTMLGRTPLYKHAPPTQEEMDRVCHVLSKSGIEAIVY
ncbi:MAG: radical SAM protein, partial [Thermoplasmata archaeon]|nr:radical SAM protein [Thermoplasmata archaeon]